MDILDQNIHIIDLVIHDFGTLRNGIQSVLHRYLYRCVSCFHYWFAFFFSPIVKINRDQIWKESPNIWGCKRGYLELQLLKCISAFQLSKPKDLLLFRKFVRRMKGSKHKIVNGQIFERAATIRPHLRSRGFCPNISGRFVAFVRSGSLKIRPLKEG